jgi:hypothetical protein
VEECFSLAKSWLDDCLHNHGNSCQGAVKPLPTRLVDVGTMDGSTPPKLIHTNSQNLPKPEDVKYAALSYCWGKETFPTTTMSTLSTFNLSIPWKDIPKTIQDAITVTRKLGFQYLWVDAFCIIQGNDDAARSDWKRESTQMHNIYTGACLTLAASHAAHAKQGLFHRRAELTRPCSIRLGPNNPAQVLLGPEPPPTVPSLEAINSRAWTLQERILSTRVLSYGTNGLRWMCRKSLHHETAPRLRHQGMSVVETGSEGTGESVPRTISEGAAHWARSEWKAIVEHYTQRNLTYINDKLPGLCGLARMIQSSCNERYLSGIWEKDLVRQLMWIHRGQNTPEGTKYRRQTEYRSPSWSWASVDGRVEFLRGYKILPNVDSTCSLDMDRSCDTEAMGSRPLLVLGVTRTIQSIRVENAARYYCGAEKLTEWLSYPDTFRTYIDDLDALPESQISDTPDGPRRLIKLLFLYLGSKDMRDSTLYAGIILLKGPGLGKNRKTYRRIGAFEGLTDSDYAYKDLDHENLKSIIYTKLKGTKKGDGRKWLSIL